MEEEDAPQKPSRASQVILLPQAPKEPEHKTIEFEESEILFLDSQRSGGAYDNFEHEFFHFESKNPLNDSVFVVQAEPDDILQGVEEPEYGVAPPELDISKLEKMRSALNLQPFKPYVFSNPLQPLKPINEIPDSQKLSDVSVLAQSKKRSGQVNPNITFMRIVDATVPKSVIKSLGKCASCYPKTSVLIMRDMGIKKVDEFNLPNLQYVDLSKNQIGSVKSCINMLKNSPYVEIIKFEENPVAQLPNYRQKIIANASIHLKIMDGKKITIAERLKSMAAFGSSKTKAQIGLYHWDLCFSATPEVRSMSSWNVSQLVMLALPKLELVTFDVSGFSSLEILDLSDNKIKEIRSLGLETCTNLQNLNLKQNLIKSRDNIKVLGFLLSLQYLSLRGNPIVNISGYKNMVIFETRFLRGSNRTTGLVELDGVPLSIEERINAISENKTSINVELWRWRYHIISHYGQKQIQDKKIATQIKNCIFVKCKLSVVHLENFVGLLYLDLSKNSIREIYGLEVLQHLQYLNLSENTKLPWQNILSRQLINTTTLEQVSFFVSNEAHPRRKTNTKYRMRVLHYLLDRNHNLVVVDEMPIMPEERLITYTKLDTYSREDVERYRFNLAVNLNVASPIGRKYHPSEVGIGSQYDVQDVIKLDMLSNYGFVSSVVDFTSFLNVQEINLANNKLTRLTGMGLEYLLQLRILDVSNNLIGGSLKALAGFMDLLSPLECIALRGNPIFKNYYEDRRKLIGLLKCTKDVNCKLQVIDTKISISERVDSWKKLTRQNSGLTLSKMGSSSKRAALKTLKGSKYENFKLELIKALRFPADLQLEDITVLDLFDCSLSTFDLSPYPKLESLLIRRNYVKTVDALTGLENLKHLKILDLRDNHLSRMEEVVSIVNDMPSLQGIGIAGNKMTNHKNYRRKFLKLLPILYEEWCNLKVLDDKIITIEEIVDVWKNKKEMSREKKFFHVLTLRKVPKGVKLDALEELDLSFCNLNTFRELRQFPALKKLSLQGNRMDSSELLGSGVLELISMQELDLSQNNIKDFNALVKVGQSLNRLVAFFVTQNPCFERNTKKLRHRLLSSLPHLADITASLTNLNGRAISVSERCRAVEGTKYDAELEEFRMDLIMIEKNLPLVDEEEAQNLTVLNLHDYGIRNLLHISRFKNLTSLDVSNNELTSLEEDILLGFTNLMHLDLRENSLEEKGSKLISVFSQMSALKHLYIQNSTKDKTKTCDPSTYVSKVCSIVRQLETLDGEPNPFSPEKRAQSLYNAKPIVFPDQQLPVNNMQMHPMPMNHLQQQMHPNMMMNNNQPMYYMIPPPVYHNMSPMSIHNTPPGMVNMPYLLEGYPSLQPHSQTDRVRPSEDMAEGPKKRSLSLSEPIAPAFRTKSREKEALNELDSSRSQSLEQELLPHKGSPRSRRRKKDRKKSRRRKEGEWHTRSSRSPRSKKKDTDEKSPPNEWHSKSGLSQSSTKKDFVEKNSLQFPDSRAQRKPSCEEIKISSVKWIASPEIEKTFRLDDESDSLIIRDADLKQLLEAREDITIETLEQEINEFLDTSTQMEHQTIKNNRKVQQIYVGPQNYANFGPVVDVDSNKEAKQTKESSSGSTLVDEKQERLLKYLLDPSADMPEDIDFLQKEEEKENRALEEEEFPEAIDENSLQFQNHDEAQVPKPKNAQSDSFNRKETEEEKINRRVFGTRQLDREEEEQQKPSLREESFIVIPDEDEKDIQENNHEFGEKFEEREQKPMEEESFPEVPESFTVEPEFEESSESDKSPVDKMDNHDTKSEIIKDKRGKRQGLRNDKKNSLKTSASKLKGSRKGKQKVDENKPLLTSLVKNHSDPYSRGSIGRLTLTQADYKPPFANIQLSEGNNTSDFSDLSDLSSDFDFTEDNLDGSQSLKKKANDNYWEDSLEESEESVSESEDAIMDNLASCPSLTELEKAAMEVTEEDILAYG